ncbi:hypothetical protein [Mycolicibacterium flavescens]|nr:hypothetical protein [Mycolicibacterium flavescens]
MKVFVIGDTGLIGSGVVAALGHEIHRTAFGGRLAEHSPATVR